MTDIVKNEETEVVVENETVDGYNAVLAVHQALQTKPTEFRDTINAMLSDRIQRAIDGKREEVATNVFNGTEPEVQVDDSAPEEDGEETAVESELEADSAEGEEEAEETQPEE